MNLLSVLLGGLIVLSILGIVKLVLRIRNRISLVERIESLYDWCEDLTAEDSRVVSVFLQEIERLENLITVNRQNVERGNVIEIERLENLITVNRQNVERTIELELKTLHNRVDICESKKCGKKGGCKPGGCKHCQDIKK